MNIVQSYSYSSKEDDLDLKTYHFIKNGETSSERDLLKASFIVITDSKQNVSPTVSLPGLLRKA